MIDGIGKTYHCFLLWRKPPQADFPVEEAFFIIWTIGILPLSVNINFFNVLLYFCNIYLLG